jgi:hypothetical protein
MLSVGSGPRLALEFEYKPLLSLEAAREAVERRNEHPRADRLLLAVNRLAPATRKVLREGGVSWIERDTGVCFIFMPGILIERLSALQKTVQPKNSGLPQLRDRAGLVAESLLKDGTADQSFRVDTTARRSSVSPAVVSRVFGRLAGLQVLNEHGKGPARFWTLNNRGILLDLWSQEERPVERITQLYVWAANTRELYDKLTSAKGMDFQWAVAGLAAANLYAPTLTTYPDPILRLDAAVPARRLVEVLGGEVVEKGGNFTVWQSKDNLALFDVGYDTVASVLPWSTTLPRVTQARAYIETISASGRAAEVAERLRERIVLGNG